MSFHWGRSLRSWDPLITRTAQHMHDGEHQNITAVYLVNHAVGKPVHELASNFVTRK